jgi:hypothetical protein
MKIFKYMLDQNPTALQYVEMPAGATVLHVGEQYGQLYVWAMVIPEATVVKYKFFVLGTGEDIGHLELVCHFLGSVQMSNGLVWHVFYKEDK